MDVSKKFFQNGLLGLALIIGVSAFGGGIYGVFNYTISTNADIASNLINPAAAMLTADPAPNSSIDYSRPETSNYTINSGGPLQAVNLKPEDLETEKELRRIQVGGNSAFVPSMWAHAGKINNEFGFRRNPFGGRTYEFHSGLDIDGERGDLVVAPANGTVTKAGWQGGYGQMIEIDHGNGLITRYAHLSKVEVEVGDIITRGQLMGLVGSTGRSTGPHLHYELRFRDTPINPRRFLPPEPTELTKTEG